MRAILELGFGGKALDACRKLGSGFRSSVLAAVALAVAHAVPAAAQNPAIVEPGNVVVTGFSGTVAYPAPAGADPFDYVTINGDGPSAQVVDVRYLGAQGQLSDALKTFAVPAAAIGQVFGVALDDAPNPNIYLAATAAYGLSIFRPDGSNRIRRVRQGTPGAQFVPGQFGSPQDGGGPGSIWRIDGVTGEVALFANVDTAGPASLGGLAFDPISQQLFVADRTTGIVYRYSLDGRQQGSYDHGVEGRGPYGLSPLPYVPQPPVNIATPYFNTESRSTWGFAAPARRVFALAVRDNRLYYSVAQGPQIWSVGISRSGAVAAGPRLEVEVPALQDGIEITAITFDGVGRMYLAERGATAGDYEMNALATGGQSRVLRFVPKQAGDPSPGNWRLAPEQYAIGLAPNYNNADGGVALGYGYGQNGVVDFDACRSTVWSTGERLLDPGDPARPQGAYPQVDGLQANAPGLVEPQNQPPLNAWYVKYDDGPGSPAYRGHMGSVAVYSPCGEPVPVAPPPYTPPPPQPPPVTCPPGTIYDSGQCIVTVTCPPGTVYSNGQCIYETCPPGYVIQGGQCVPPPVACPPGMAFYKGRCIPLECPPNMERRPNGECVCRGDQIFYNGRCVPQNACPPGMIKYPNGICWCPRGQEYINGRCVIERCPPGYHKGPNGVCIPDYVKCGPGEILVNGQCVPKNCPPGYHKGPNGVCIPNPVKCGPGEILVNGQCVPKNCPPGFHKGPNGVCIPNPANCGPGEILVNGQCVPKNCPPGYHKGPNGVCIPDFVKCGPGEVLVNGRCVPKSCPPGLTWENGRCVPIRCGQNEQFVNGKCVPIRPLPPKCKPGEELVKGKCVPIKCSANQQLVNGKCVALPPKCKQGEELVKGKCVPIKCSANQQLVNGKCVALPPKCKQGEELVKGKCVPVKPPPQACNGVKVGGACWYLGNGNQSCKQVCSNHGGYDGATKDYAGSGGSNANCDRVLKALKVGRGSMSNINWKGFGCYFSNIDKANMRDKKNTDAGASATGVLRACACSK